MLLVRQYLRIPSAPPEREPTPESFQPSIGTDNDEAMTLLMFTVPVFILRANALTLFLSRVHTLPDNPNSESLAF